MRGAFFAVILSVVFFHAVNSSPLKALVGDGPPGNIAKIKEATDVANKKIKNMQAVLNGPNPKSHPAVVKAFGTNANINEIKNNVNTLETGKFKVPNSDAVSGVTQGATNTETKAVSFGSTFFNSNSKERAGTVIHEAAHALHGAVDHFDQHGNPHPQGSTFDKGKAQVGYKDSHLDQLKTQASHNMHHNADSYRVFGEECPEAREFFRRAMEETDSVVHAHLIRRGAKACAYRPKEKGASKAPADKTPSRAPAAKAATRKASGSKAAVNSGGRKASSKAPVRARPVAVSKTAGSRRPVSRRPVSPKPASSFKNAPKPKVNPKKA